MRPCKSFAVEPNYHSSIERYQAMKTNASRDNSQLRRVLIRGQVVVRKA